MINGLSVYNNMDIRITIENKKTGQDIFRNFRVEEDENWTDTIREMIAAVKETKKPFKF